MGQLTDRHRGKDKQGRSRQRTKKGAVVRVERVCLCERKRQANFSSLQPCQSVSALHFTRVCVSELVG